MRRTVKGVIRAIRKKWPSSNKKGRRLPALPAGAPDTELTRLLCANPRPLIDPSKRIIVLFSPKSACSNVVIWFFHQLGHAAAAQDYDQWPHKYRGNVYYKSALYRRAFQQDLSRYSVLRVIRDPYERAVSSFRHVHRNGSADHLITRALGRSDIATSGLSFSEFLDFLETCDLAKCDGHYRLQRHPLEDRLPTRYLINASTEDLYSRLNEVEADLGNPITDFSKLEWLHRINRTHSHVAAPFDAANTYTHRFDRAAARSGSWPGYDAFLTTEARERLARLYAADIRAYGTTPLRVRADRAAPSGALDAARSSAAFSV
jgi:hypothetical protein